MLTFYSLRSVRRKSCQYAVKCLLFSRPFSNFVPSKNCKQNIFTVKLMFFALIDKNKFYITKYLKHKNFPIKIIF